MYNLVDVYFDGQPTDWISTSTISNAPLWHTFTFLIISDYEKFEICKDQIITRIGQFKYWSIGKKRASTKNYQIKVFSAFTDFWTNEAGSINIVSFNESELLHNSSFILQNWSESGQPISFQIKNENGYEIGVHSYVDFYGFHEIKIKTKKLFTLLPLAYLIRDQYYFYQTNNKSDKILFANLCLDPLSGDNQNSVSACENLKLIVKHQFSNSLLITINEIPKAQQKSQFQIVDNFSGLFNTIIKDNDFRIRNKEKIQKLYSRISWNRISFRDMDYHLEKIDLSSLY